MGSFDPDKHAKKVVDFAKDFLKDTGDKPIIIGISGGKDSTITTAALVEAVGKERVIGLMLPNNIQRDISDAREVCKYFGIRNYEIDINDMYQGMLRNASDALVEKEGDGVDWNTVVTTNAPCRCRMVMLYLVANQLHGRVANTCNLSESYVGYDTKFGDQTGDFGLFQDYTATEEKQIGRVFGLPSKFIDKIPDDGMCGMSDEDRWGFPYSYLDSWIRCYGLIVNDIDKKIVTMHQNALHKIKAVQIPHPSYHPENSHCLTDDLAVWLEKDFRRLVKQDHFSVEGAYVYGC